MKRRINQFLICWFFCFCFRLQQSSFHWIISNRIANRIGRNWNVWILLTSILSPDLMTPFTTPIFDFHLVLSALTTPAMAQTLTLSLVKTSFYSSVIIPTTEWNNNCLLFAMQLGGTVASCELDSWLSGPSFKPWTGTLRCVLGQETWLSQCLSPPRCINGYQQLILGVTLQWTSIPTRG